MLSFFAVLSGDGDGDERIMNTVNENRKKACNKISKSDEKARARSS